MNFGAGRRGHYTGTATLNREMSRKSNIHGVSSKLGQFLKTTTRLDMLGICCILLLQGLLADITRRNAVDQRWHLLSRQNGVTSHVLTCCFECIDKSSVFFTRRHKAHEQRFWMFPW
jgi:hypothetical protein